MALNVATLALILCRQVKTIKHGRVRINIVHFPITCFLNFCSAVPTPFFSFLMIFLLAYIYISTQKGVGLSSFHGAYIVDLHVFNRCSLAVLKEI